MLKRLWLVLCVLWTVPLLLLALFGDGNEAGKQAICGLIVAPWIIGYVIPFVFRYIVSGDFRRPRFFAPRS